MTIPIITAEIVRAINGRHPRAQVAADAINKTATLFGIDSRNKMSMFLAQLGHESGLVPQEENLSYRATRICQVWPTRFPTVESAMPFQFNPRALGDRVYGGRMGNAGNEGFLFRGRGPIQITGKDNYLRYRKRTGFDIIANPDLCLQYGVGFQISGAFWQDAGCSVFAERGDIRTVTRLINGGYNGLDDREVLYQRALNRVPRYGLLAQDAPLDVVADAEMDMSNRYDLLNRIASWI